MLPPHDSQKETVFYAIIKTPEIKTINQLNREGFTDSKEETRKEKAQIQQKLQSFESKRLKF